MDELYMKECLALAKEAAEADEVPVGAFSVVNASPLVSTCSLYANHELCENSLCYDLTAPQPGIEPDEHASLFRGGLPSFGRLP